MPCGGTLASVAVAAPTVTLTITEGAGAADTSVGSFTVALAPDPTGIRDAAGNLASFDGRPDRWCQADPTVRARCSTTTPTARSTASSTTFSETLAPFTAPATVFVADVGTVGRHPQQRHRVRQPGHAGAQPGRRRGDHRRRHVDGSRWQANVGGIRDAAGNLSSFASTAPTDRAAPVRLTLTMLDNDVNGKVDRVTATFSEPLAAYTGRTTPWTLANVPSGGALASVSHGGHADGDAHHHRGSRRRRHRGRRDDRGAGSRRRPASATQPATWPRFAATAPADGARPIRQSTEMFDDDVDGKVDRVPARSARRSAPSPPDTPWTLANVPSGATLNNVTVAAHDAHPHPHRRSRRRNTAVGTLTVALASQRRRHPRRRRQPVQLRRHRTDRPGRTRPRHPQPARQQRQRQGRPRDRTVQRDAAGLLGRHSTVDAHQRALRRDARPASAWPRRRSPSRSPREPAPPTPPSAR